MPDGLFGISRTPWIFQNKLDIPKTKKTNSKDKMNIPKRIGFSVTSWIFQRQIKFSMTARIFQKQVGYPEDKLDFFITS